MRLLRPFGIFGKGAILASHDIMSAWLAVPWPWYVAGPVIGLFVSTFLLTGNKVFGIFGNLRHRCSALIPGKLEHFRCDWKNSGLWNLVFLLGVLTGGFLAAHIASSGSGGGRFKPFLYDH
jgi:hypothetical protein